ncbi:MAG: endonuclease/exonuclease/phosphatase family protein [Actinomycetota bacterium]|nr:endonuclease/exonuclease/phosphatase family protein [Actinomycetota bacterium]
MPTLRLLSYNVRSMRDDRDALARVIRSAEPDVVCVQEAPRFLRWRSTCAALARRSGLVVVGGGRPAGANLILSSLAVDVIKTVDVQFSKEPALHQRGAALAVLRFRGSEFSVVGTHLDVRAEARLGHVIELDSAISRYLPPERPVVVAADVNDHPGSPTWLALVDRRTDAFAAAGTGSAFTSTAADPHQTIDGIFIDPRISVVAARVLDGPDVPSASDHRPVLAVLELPD